MEKTTTETTRDKTGKISDKASIKTRKALSSAPALRAKAPWHLDVAPLTSLPLTRGQWLTYASSTEVRPGALVSIPVMTRTLKGVVFASRDTGRIANRPLPFKVKSILSVIQEDFLTQEQLKLALFISKEYFTSLGRCLVHFAPQIAKARVKAELPSIREALPPKTIRPTDEQKAAIEAIAKPGQKPFLLFGPSSSGKTEVYIRAIKKILETKQGGQALVLVPELTLIPQEIGRYSQAFGADNVTVMHSHIAPGAFYATWGKIARGEVSVIIGTRQALFAPFRNLSLVVVDEEQDDAYKQWDMSPRYDGQRVAEELAALHGAALVFGSATPSIERYHKAVTGTYGLLTLSPLPMQPKYAIDLINMRFERHNKNNSSLSETLGESILETLKSKRQILLFINRQGASSFSVCEGCSAILRCPSCDRALIYDAAIGTYRCLHCAHKSSAVPSCPNCGGIVFKNVGTGTQKIEREIRKRFPYARVARIDRQTMQKQGSQEKIFRSFAQGEIDILIGTQMATKGWDLPNVALVGMIDADSLFAWADFKTDENAFQHILQAAGRMARIGGVGSGRAIIQTFYPENPTLLKVQSKDYPAFYREIADQREALFYPPFGRIVKIAFQDEDAKKADREIGKIHTKLEAMAQTDRKLRVSAPQTPFLSKIRGHHRRNVILRYRGEAFPEELKDFLRKISKNSIIDVDPVSIS